MLWLLSDCPDAQEGENDSGTTGKKKKKKKKKPAGAKTEEAQGKAVSGQGAEVKTYDICPLQSGGPELYINNHLLVCELTLNTITLIENSIDLESCC